VTLWGAGRLSLIHQDTAESGWEAKKGRKLNPATLSKQKAKQEQQMQR
jgi:hypothetical protein